MPEEFYMRGSRNIENGLLQVGKKFNTLSAQNRHLIRSSLRKACFQKETNQLSATGKFNIVKGPLCAGATKIKLPCVYSKRINWHPMILSLRGSGRDMLQFIAFVI